MTSEPEHRHTISEVSAQTGVPPYTLRQWEKLFPMLRPKRDRANRRYYLDADIDIVRRIKQLHWVQKIQPEGVRVRLSQELHGTGRPQTRREAVAILDRMEKEIRAMLDLLDGKT